MDGGKGFGGHYVGDQARDISAGFGAEIQTEAAGLGVPLKEKRHRL
jgi:hypothetical protein